jgi:hypothetical protein
MHAKSRPITAVSAVLLVTALVIVSATARAQTSQNTQIILNLLNGQQYFGVPHVYIGYTFLGNITTQWPAYYSPSNASQYWSLAGINSDQPVLELFNGRSGSGVMYWPTHYDGGNITMSFTMTYTLNASFYPGPVSVYLFIKPLGWDIAPMYNFSIPNARLSPIVSLIFPPIPMTPQSATSYLIITWSPGNRIKQWAVAVVNTSLSLAYLGGNGSAEPKPGDMLNIAITYDPNTNIIHGTVRDLNTSEVSMFTAGLDGNFTPPSPGYYVFGIGTTSQWIGIFGGSGYYDISTSPNTTVPLSRAPAPKAFQANWGLLFAAVSQQPSMPPPPPAISTSAVQIISVPNSPVASIPGVVYGVLYSSSGFEALAYMNSSGYLNFNNLTPGTYTLEVYHYPNTGLNLTEYWGNATIAVQAGYNGYAFTRHEPWIYDLQPMAGSGQIVVNVTVDNPLGNAVQGEVELWVTSNPSTASPYAPSAVRYVTLNPGLNTFTISYPVSQAGTYYVYAAVSAMISQYLPTDQRNWTLIEQQISQYTTTTTSTATTTATTTSITTTATTAATATQTVQPSVRTATTATGASGIQPPPLVVVPTPQSTAAANGQIRQIGALQIATWALVGVAAFLLAYLLSGFVLSRKQ